MAASALSLSSACKASVFSESSPVPPYFLSLKILPMEGSSDKVTKKKSIRFWATSVCVVKYVHNYACLVHLFAETPKIIKFNR